jgi:hypothetical protein
VGLTVKCLKENWANWTAELEDCISQCVLKGSFRLIVMIGTNVVLFIKISGGFHCQHNFIIGVNLLYYYENMSSTKYDHMQAKQIAQV